MSRTAATVVFLVAMSCPALVGAQSVPLLPVDEVELGMKGYGLTVFKGIEIEKFTVEVIDVLRNHSPTRHMILVRCGGETVEHTGIIGGMSGSPVYLEVGGEARLIGALAYAWSFVKEPIAGITPIEYMLADMERPLEESGWLNPTGPSLFPSYPQLRPCPTPIMCSGFSGRTLAALREELGRFGLEPVQGGGSAAENLGDRKVELEPGSAIGIPFAEGDLSMTAIGTVTYREGDRVLAFGHPLFNGGRSELPITTAYIHTVIPSIARSNKLGGPVETVGTLLQDRPSCVFAELGSPASMIPVEFSLSNPRLGTAHTYNFQIIHHRRFTFVLLNILSWESMDASENLMGENTVRARMRVKLEGYEPLELEEAFSNTSSPSLGGLFYPVYQLQGNPHEKVRIEHIAVEAEVVAAHERAAIEAAWLEVQEASPGESLRLHVRLHPYRCEPVERLLDVAIPEEAPEGAFEIRVQPGSLIPQDLPPDRSVEELLQLLKTRYTATDLVVTLPTSQLELRIRGRKLPQLPNSILGAWIPHLQEEAVLAVHQRHEAHAQPWVLWNSASAIVKIVR